MTASYAVKVIIKLKVNLSHLLFLRISSNAKSLRLLNVERDIIFCVKVVSGKILVEKLVFRARFRLAIRLIE